MKEIEYLDLMKYPYISADWVPYGALCVYCRGKAWRYLQITGGSRHNQGGNYCWSCGREYIFMICEMEEYKGLRRGPSPQSERIRARSSYLQ